MKQLGTSRYQALPAHPLPAPSRKPSEDQRPSHSAANEGRSNPAFFVNRPPAVEITEDWRSITFENPMNTIATAQGTRLIRVEVIHTPEQQCKRTDEYVESLRRQIAELQREIDASLEWDCSVERKSTQLIGIDASDPRFADEENYPTVRTYDPAEFAGEFQWINTPPP